MGERSGIAPIHSQLLKQHKQQRAFYWASMQAFFAFFGLLRAFRAAALHHTANIDMHTTFSQQPTDWHLLAVQIGPRPMDATAYAATNTPCR